ncbi:MAG: DUF2309 domain-containing protein [Planctomycetaceae bacterium]|nr:DUF2309 domain-containing protein [Planctomycetaceae bacterium]
MTASASVDDECRTSTQSAEVERLSQLREQIEHAAHLLPSQGPITVFVHHNTLHAFEDLGFDEGVKVGGRLYECHAYLPESQYRRALESGRIRVADLEAVLHDDLGNSGDFLVHGKCSRHALRLAMLRYPLLSGDVAELRWFIAETDALRCFRSEVETSVRERMIETTRRWALGADNRSALQAEQDLTSDWCEQFELDTAGTWDDRRWEAFTLNSLWSVCRNGITRSGRNAAPATTRSLRPRDVLLDATGVDADQLVHDELISFCSAFIDQGFSEWELPNRHAGFYEAFLNLHSRGVTCPTSWSRAICQETRRLRKQGASALESIEESLSLLGIDGKDSEQFLTDSLVALRGWAGMVWQLETEAEWAPRPAPKGSLIGFLAVRLILDRIAAAQVAADTLRYRGPIDGLPAAVREVRHEREPVAERTSFLLFQLAQVLGWSPEDLYRLTAQEWRRLVNEVDDFSSFERRRLLHLAYERKYRQAAFDAIVTHSRRLLAHGAWESSDDVPAYQLVTCIDDREESFRRHLEEVDPGCETFGVAGFYGVAMYYRGVADAHFKPLCPANVKPRHFVVEETLYSLQANAEFRAEARRRLGRATHQAHLGSRSFVGGIITTLAGSLAAFPLVARILFPHLTARFRRLVGRIVQPPATQLRLERLATEPGPENGQLGYSVEEMAGIVEAILRAIGLTRGWSRLVAYLGHGSASLNNPHESAYCCGACSGSRGGPNARAFAQMANDHRVRELLAQRGLQIPPTTYFVGGYHDTTNESVSFYDLDRLPISHRSEFERMWDAITETRRRNAHERCRRFLSAPAGISPAEALRHVEARPEDLSQPRPEYNHATNALCLVGRRTWSRGLYLDRRSFLASYDPTQDDERGTILEGILRPVIPVCGGISLEYYFSTIDVEGYGCGSKLPHNIASLLGVMSGAQSDLRPGLSAQMVEIHEPLRILFIVESTPEILKRIVRENEPIRLLVDGNWVQLAAFDAETATIQRYVNGEFSPYRPESPELSVVLNSLDWYRGSRDHLGFAEIVPSQEVAT